VIFRSVGS